MPSDTVDPLAALLRARLSPSQVLTDPQITAAYETDWTRRWSGRARMVARPRTTAEVATVIEACGAINAPVVPQGGNTGLVGGGVPRGGEVVVSLAGLDREGPVDLSAGQLTVGAGVTLAKALALARKEGLDFGVDLAARDSATVGGMVATNAGGIHALRHGTMRANVLGLEAVMADGSVVTRMHGACKDNVGYDLAGLLAGSEGTLGIITRVVLRLVPLLPHRVVALVAVGRLDGTASAGRGSSVEGTLRAVAVLSRLRRSLGSLQSAEIFYPSGMSLVQELLGLRDPFPGTPDPGAYLLFECADWRDPLEELSEALSSCPEVSDTAVSTDSQGMEDLWSYRERHTEAIALLGIPHKMDVCLPLSRIAEFVSEVGGLVESASPGARTVMFGHLGDGNVHVNVVGPDPDDTSVDTAVLSLAARLGGSISAEHGIGIAKASLLGLSRSGPDVAAMSAIKGALDPRGLLNPGVIFERPPRGRTAGLASGLSRSPGET